MKYNLKEQLFDKIGGLEFVNPDEYGAKYNKGVREAKAIVVSFFNNELVPEVPQYVADWVEYCKNTSLSLARALNVSEEDFHNYANQKDHIELLTFLGSMVNQEKFSKAWLFGYEVEKVKKYLVKMKGFSGYGRYLNKALSSGEYFLGSKNEVDGYRTKHTRKELEKNNFGWLFSCEGVEVEEVEE